LTPAGRYRLGLRVLQLGGRALDGLDLRSLARASLEELAATTGETATLSVSGGRDAVTLDFAASPQAIQSVAQLGRPSIAHATATGKVLLAFGDVPHPEAPLARFTEKTIVDLRTLRREIERVRTGGYAEAVGEREADLAAIAVAVRGRQGELSAILGVQGPLSRFDAAARARALDAVREAADTLSRRLGWPA
jgi:IclR family acetate operon transcriptional repressor